MKKYIKIMFILFSWPIIINAKECDWSEISAKKNLARNINWIYEYYLKNNSMYFDITATNIYEDLYIKDTSNGKTYNSKEITLRAIPDNKKISFEIYSRTCNEIISTKDIVLPAYNRYYGTSYCEGISEFSLCRKWGILSSSTTEEVLKKQTDEYRKLLSAPIEIEQKQYETNITGFYIFVSLIIFVLLMFLVSIFHSKREKDFI